MSGSSLPTQRSAGRCGRVGMDHDYVECRSQPARLSENFLVAILQRKLAAVEAHFAPATWQRESLFAIASIYAIELLEDNHRDAQAALLGEFVKFNEAHGTLCSPTTSLYRAAAFLVETNILRGNTLTGRTPDGAEIEFSWWTRQTSDPSMVKREPFTFNSLREDSGFDFTVHTTFEPCAIDQIHEKATTDA